KSSIWFSTTDGARELVCAYVALSGNHCELRKRRLWKLLARAHAVIEGNGRAFSLVQLRAADQQLRSSGSRRRAKPRVMDLLTRDFIIWWLNPTPHAQAVYALLNACAQRRLGHATSLGRAAEMAVIVERHQMPQMAQRRQVHHRFFRSVCTELLVGLIAMSAIRAGGRRWRPGIKSASRSC